MYYYNHMPVSYNGHVVKCLSKLVSCFLVTYIKDLEADSTCTGEEIKCLTKP